MAMSCSHKSQPELNNFSTSNNLMSAAKMSMGTAMCNLKVDGFLHTVHVACRKVKKA